MGDSAEGLVPVTGSGVPPVSFAVRLGSYFLQGRNGWGPLECAETFPTERAAHRVADAIPFAVVVSLVADDALGMAVQGELAL